MTHNGTRAARGGLMGGDKSKQREPESPGDVPAVHRLRVLVACEFSGTVRDAFAALGHDAWSCDVKPTAKAGKHIWGDARKVLGEGWDLMVAHPPCTHLAVSGARWFNEKRRQMRIGYEGPVMGLQEEALDFVRELLEAPIPRKAIENPVSVISSRIRPPDQIIQPWQFGDEYQKTTCLWLVGVPPLVPTKIVPRGEIVIHGGKRFAAWISNRTRDRSETFPGIAAAMAAQWGRLTPAPVPQSAEQPATCTEER